MSEKLLIMHQFTKSENSHGLEVGDMLVVKKTNQLIRYVGVRYGGLDNTPYDKKLLRFSQGFPVRSFNLALGKTYYLVTEESSSQGFIAPLTIKGLEKISFLNEYIKDIKKDFDKVGNIPQFLWSLMEREALEIDSVVKKNLH